MSLLKPVSLTPRRGVLTLSGYGLRIAVERGHLVVSDGAGRARRAGRFSRVTSQLRRVVILGSSGQVSLDALRWLQDTRASVVQVDHDGRLVTVTASAGLDDARLRRAQARAFESGIALEMARDLIAAKIEEQAATLTAVTGQRATSAAIGEAVAHVQRARTIDRVRYIEARAASAYWHGWVGVTLRFPSQDAKRIPAHWLTLGERHSPLSESARRGVTPLNAMLNYCYAIAEAEARIALVAAGCDPGLGVLHADRQGRDSLALDILEPVRPHVDAYILGLVRDHTFTRADFFENRSGECRLMPPLTTTLSETAGRWAKLLQPIAHRIARRFERAGAAGNVVPSADSRAAIVVGDDDARLPAVLRARRTMTAAPSNARDTSRRCRRCGAAIAAKRNVYCPDCITSVPAMASDYARLALQRRQREEAGAGPTAETRQLLGDARSRRAASIREWEAKQAALPSPQQFAKTILPMLTGVTAQAVRDVTGLSISYCRRVLRGQYVPHAMHWKPISGLATKGHAS